MTQAPRKWKKFHTKVETGSVKKESTEPRKLNKSSPVREMERKSRHLLRVTRVTWITKRITQCRHKADHATEWYSSRDNEIRVPNEPVEREKVSSTTVNRQFRKQRNSSLEWTSRAKKVFSTTVNRKLRTVPTKSIDSLTQNARQPSVKVTAQGPQSQSEVKSSLGVNWDISIDISKVTWHNVWVSEVRVRVLNAAKAVIQSTYISSKVLKMESKNARSIQTSWMWCLRQTDEI